MKSKIGNKVRNVDSALDALHNEVIKEKYNLAKLEDTAWLIIKKTLDITSTIHNYLERILDKKDAEISAGEEVLKKYGRL